MRREFETDLSMILAKDEMVDLFNELGSHGHVLWIISDTYYSRDQVGLMLRKAGVTGAYRLLVSSEEQKRKDNGTMWHMVKNDLQHHGVTTHIHIGDNVVADCQIPGDFGLTTMHILHPTDKWQALGFPKLKENSSTLNEYEIQNGEGSSAPSVAYRLYEDLMLERLKYQLKNSEIGTEDNDNATQNKIGCYCEK